MVMRVRISETSVYFYETSWCNTLEEIYHFIHEAVIRKRSSDSLNTCKISYLMRL